MKGVPAPVLAVSSSAERARQTAELVVEAMGGRVPLDSYRALYDAEPSTAQQYLREIDPAVPSALLVGHNPTMVELAWELVDEGTGDRTTIESFGFPTCALAVLAIPDADWSALGPGRARLIGLFRPTY